MTMRTASFLFLLALLPLPAWGQAPRAIEGTSPVGSLNIRFRQTTLTLASLESDFQDRNGNGALDAEETATLRVTLTNGGPGKAYGVTLTGTIPGTHPHLSGGLSRDMGTLKPGQAATAGMALAADEFLEDGTVVIHLEAAERYGRSARPLEVTIETRALVPPELVMGDFGIDDDQEGTSYGNANGKIEKGETIEVKTYVQNVGAGPAEGVRVDLVVPKGILFMSATSFPLGDLDPGQYLEIEFAFSVPTTYTGAPTLAFELRMAEKRKRFGTTAPLDFAMNRTQKRTGEVEPTKVTIRPAPGKGRVEIAAAPTLTIDVDVDIPKTARVNRDAVAVVIGNRDYGFDDVPDVEYAIRDAAVVRDYLIDAFGYREGNILYYTNATSATFRSLFGSREVPEGRLARLVKAGRSDVFIYYSGHGAPDVAEKSAYFVPVDCHPDDLRLNGYPLDLFYENLSKIDARSVTIAIDACFSGGSPGGSLIGRASPVGVVVVDPAAGLRDATVFVSSSGTDISSWYPEKKHGLFTYFFLEGLRGAADRDRDGKITAAELISFVSDPDEGVPYLSRSLFQGRHQVPQLLGDRDRVILEVTE